MENTFWSTGINKDHGDFMKSFKKSFTLYVESGMKKKVEADIDILCHQSVDLATDEFKGNFCKFIIKHYLRKFHFIFYFFCT